MSVNGRQLSNFLHNTSYRFYVHRLPNVTFSVNKINIPGLALPNPTSGNPFVRQPIPGDHLAYNELRVTYCVDDQMTNYIEIYNWLRGLASPKNFDERSALLQEPGSGRYSDILVTILDGKKIAKADVTFHDALPVALSDLQFDSTIVDMDYITVEATFMYRDFEISLSS